MVGKIAIDDDGLTGVVTKEVWDTKKTKIAYYEMVPLTPKEREDVPSMAINPRVLGDLQDFIDYGKLSTATVKLIHKESEESEQKDSKTLAAHDDHDDTVVAELSESLSTSESED